MTGFWTLRRHALAWLCLAGLALLYLFGLYYFPSLARPQAERDDPLRPSLAREALQAAPAKTENVAKLSMEIRSLREKIEELIERSAVLDERVAALESALGPATSALPPSAPDIITGATKRKTTLAAPVPKVTVSYSAMPEDGFGDTFLNRSPLPIAGLQQPTRTLFGVELATAESTGALRKQWVELSGRHEPLLGKLNARQYRLEGPAEDHGIKLIVGPFTNAADAAVLCVQLRAAGTPCKETVFVGEALPPE